MPCVFLEHKKVPPRCRVIRRQTMLDKSGPSFATTIRETAVLRPSVLAEVSWPRLHLVPDLKQRH